MGLPATITHRDQKKGAIQGIDPVDNYFQCITTCSIDDGECITRCVEQLKESND